MVCQGSLLVACPLLPVFFIVSRYALSISLSSFISLSVRAVSGPLSFYE
jgi:hypothetical protein